MILLSIFALLAMEPVLAASRMKTLPLIPHHVHVKRQQRSLRHLRTLKAQQVDAAYQGYGTHYIDLWTGTPPQRQTLIINTGAPGIGFPCSNCVDNCGDTSNQFHTDRFFDETASLTFRTVHCGECEVGECKVDSSSPSGKCTKGFAYAEGSSWSGFEAKDMAYIGGPHDKALAKGEGDGEIHDDIDPDQAREYQFELDFVCQTSLTGLFKTQLADGILGMDNSRNAYWHQAMRANITTDSSAFSLCFARQPTASRKGTEAGAFTLGGFDERLHNQDSPVVYASFDPYGSKFDVDVKAIYMRKGGGGDSALSTNGSLPILSLELSKEVLHSGKIDIDSGTTDTYLPRRFTADFERVWKEVTDTPYTHYPLQLTEEELNDLPTILFQIQGDYHENQKLGSSPYPLGTLGSAVPNANRTKQENFDVVVAMPPSHYMEWDKRAGGYVNRLYIDEVFDSVLGANFLMGHDVMFDVDRGRIGFAESTCDYLGLLDKQGEPNPWERPGEDDGGVGKGTNASDVLGTQGDSKTPAEVAGEGENGNDSQGIKSETTDSASSVGAIAVVVLLAVTLGVVGGVYGKRLYDQRFGTTHYQVADSELELKADQEATDTFTIT